MISEKWDTRFDIGKLREHLEKYVLPLEPVRQSTAFGGWSIQSSNGSYKDGWHLGSVALDDKMSVEEIKKFIESIGLKPISDYVRPTEICHGYLKFLIDFLAENKLDPRRARVTKLSPGQSSVWHRDAPDNYPLVRLHIPIVTNPECRFETEAGCVHLPADGSSYFLPVNRMHRVVNDGSTERYHIIVDVNGFLQSDRE